MKNGRKPRSAKLFQVIKCLIIEFSTFLKKFDILKEIQFRIISDNNLKLLDFKCNSFGMCYIPRPTVEQHETPIELKQLVLSYRKQLACVYNVNNSLFCYYVT